MILALLLVLLGGPCPDDSVGVRTTVVATERRAPAPAVPTPHASLVVAQHVTRSVAGGRQVRVLHALPAAAVALPAPPPVGPVVVVAPRPPLSPRATPSSQRDPPPSAPA